MNPLLLNTVIYIRNGFIAKKGIKTLLSIKKYNSVQSTNYRIFFFLIYWKKGADFLIKI